MSEANGKGTLAQALVKAQAEFPAIPKNKKTTIPLKNGGHREYHYADLASILEATRPALTKNGIALTQPIIAGADYQPVLQTRLLHISGDLIMSDYPLPKGAGSQEMGSAITYARRYSLQAILGISADDDDDGEASTQGVAKPVKQYVVKKQEAAPPKEPLVVPDNGPDPSDTRSWEVATILKVAMKEGEKNGKKWQRFGVLLALQDGEETWVNTFDRDYGATASSLQGGMLAKVALAPGKPFNGKETTDLVGIEPMPDESDSTEPAF